MGAAKREMDELASVVDELENTLDVQDVEDLRELSESMYEGLATIRETHKDEESRLPASSSASSHATFGSPQSSSSGTGAVKGRQDREEGLSIRKNLF